MTTNFHIQRVGPDKIRIQQPGYVETTLTRADIVEVMKTAEPRRKEALERAANMLSVRKTVWDRLQERVS